MNFPRGSGGKSPVWCLGEAKSKIVNQSRRHLSFMPFMREKAAYWKTFWANQLLGEVPQKPKQNAKLVYSF